jgi:hypothetical protein
MIAATSEATVFAASLNFAWIAIKRLPTVLARQFYRHWDTPLFGDRECSIAASYCQVGNA